MISPVWADLFRKLIRELYRSEEDDPYSPSPTTAAMKHSFSLRSKPQSSLKKPSAKVAAFVDKVEKSNHREYVTEFDSSKLSVDPSKAKEDRVIPPIADEWRSYKKMKNLQSAAADHQQPSVQFEVDPLSSSVEPSSNSMSYGLNLRSNNSNSTNDIREDSMMVREDSRRLTDENEFDDFADMPIEGFGRALLAGYGWKEGQGIGRNGKTKEDVKSVEYKRRTGKEGLGFTGKLSKYGTSEAQRDEKGLKANNPSFNTDKARAGGPRKRRGEEA